MMMEVVSEAGKIERFEILEDFQRQIIAFLSRSDMNTRADTTCDIPRHFHQSSFVICDATIYEIPIVADYSTKTKPVKQKQTFFVHENHSFSEIRAVIFRKYGISSELSHLCGEFIAFCNAPLNSSALLHIWIYSQPEIHSYTL